MRHGSLFSGIGGFDLAAEWMGWENVFHCENAEYPKKILKQHFPNAISYDDIKQTDFSIHRGQIDVLSGGFPCQPYSTAGKRLGKEDERHLWPEMLRAIREIAPRWVVGENVRGLVSWSSGLVFDEVQSDLETEGFEVLPFILPACAVNAPHRRERVWFIAHANSVGSGRDNELSGIYSEGTRKGLAEGYELNALHGGGFIAHATGEQDRRIQQLELSADFGAGNKKYAPSTYSEGLEELQRQAPERNRDGWQNWPTQSPLCGGDDGFPDRVDQLKGLGNAVVPRLVYKIFKAIEQYENL